MIIVVASRREGRVAFCRVAHFARGLYQGDRAIAKRNVFLDAFLSASDVLFSVVLHYHFHYHYHCRFISSMYVNPAAGVTTTTTTTMTQSLGAATLNEFKRTHKKSQTDMAAAAAAAAAAAVAEAAEEAPSVTARLDLLLEKKRNAVLGPSKISTAESRGEREYQVCNVVYVPTVSYG